MKKMMILTTVLAIVGTLCSCTQKHGRIAGHEYVDLGLSVKWATTNIGAEHPSDYGSYYAWGETRIKASYDSNSSFTEDKYLGDIAGNPEYDAATANWGKSWRLPTLEEIDELIKKCEWQWTTMDGHNGYIVIGPNGNSIFLPAAGYFNRLEQKATDEDAYYWSSSPDGAHTSHACELEFDSRSIESSSSERYYGDTIRPVSK